MSKFRLNFRGLLNRPVFNAIVTIASAVLGAIVVSTQCLSPHLE